LAEESMKEPGFGWTRALMRWGKSHILIGGEGSQMVTGIGETLPSV